MERKMAVFNVISTGDNIILNDLEGTESVGNVKDKLKTKLDNPDIKIILMHGSKSFNDDNEQVDFTKFKLTNLIIGKDKGPSGGDGIRKRINRCHKTKRKMRKNTKLKTHKGPRGGKYYISKGRKVYL
jgi:hypothetical protein